jgi:hypothetical protein
MGVGKDCGQSGRQLLGDVEDLEGAGLGQEGAQGQVVGAWGEGAWEEEFVD